MIRKICPLCQTKLTKVKNGSWRRCPTCGLVVLPKKAKSELFYNYRIAQDLKAMGILEQAHTAYGNWQRRRLVGRYFSAGRILDMGCGGGQFLAGFNSKWEKYGIDLFDKPEPSMLKKISFCTQNLHDCHYPDGFFDVITAWHVLEHLDAPIKNLKEIKRILKKDGIFILTTPCTESLGFHSAKNKWFHLDLKRHNFLYNQSSLTGLFKAGGLKVKKIFFPGFEYPLDLFRSMGDFTRGKQTFVLLLLSPFILATIFVKTLALIIKKTETVGVLGGK